MSFVPSMERVVEGSELRAITLGHPLIDAYLEFVGARGAKNTWLATAYDLKVFFVVVGKEPADVTSADVFGFLRQQRTPGWAPPPESGWRARRPGPHGGPEGR
jgi:hypothetical protein